MLVNIITNPFIALGISIGLGAWLGGLVKYKTFNLGMIAGSLFVSVVVGQIGGFNIPPEVGSIFFSLFIFAIGIEAGSTFFKSLNKSTLLLLTTTIVTTLVGLILVVIAAHVFHLDKGLAAGLAAGAMTQSSIIGAAGDALAKLNLSASAIKTMQVNVAVGYSMTYIMGSFLPILVTTGVIPLIKKWNLREEALTLAAEQSKGMPVLEPGQFEALNVFSTRVFKVKPDASIVDKHAADLFASRRPRIAVEAIIRDGKKVRVEKATTILAGDIIAVTAHTGFFEQLEQEIGEEVNRPDNMMLVQERRSVIVTNKKYDSVKIADIDPNELCSVFIQEIRRHSERLPVDRDSIIKKGDELILIGKIDDVDAASKFLGMKLTSHPVTDYTRFSLFLALGYLIGLTTFKLFGIMITLGSGIGCLLSGIFMGWLHTQKPQYGKVPPGAIKWLKDFGLATFVAIIGLNAGQEALQEIIHHGATIFVLGLFVSTLPMIAAYLWMTYILRIRNPIAICGALNGARSSNPGFAAVLNAAGNATPIQYFTPTYAMAQISQTILGVLIVAIVPFVVS